MCTCAVSVEQFAMAHYSVFYYLARATLQINTEGRIFFEDVYNVLRMACYNVPKVVRAVQWMCRSAGKPMPTVTDKQVIAAAAEAIIQYRNALLKNPVLGRVEHNGALIHRRAIL
jgi:hypothetical protein